MAEEMGMMRAIRSGLRAGAVALTLMAAPALAAGGAVHYEAPEGGWSFDGPFGTYDRAALQRGTQVYMQVCSACHGLKHVAWRNLSDPGGPGFSEAEVKALAATFQVPAPPSEEDGSITDEDGFPLKRPALPSDKILGPYLNEFEARAANNGALPPDLALMAKARGHGPDYIYSLMLGYVDPPEGLRVPDGQYYNKYFAGTLGPYWDGDPHHVPQGGFIAMPQQLFEDLVEFADGTAATPEQMAQDLVVFLNWAAEPELEARKKLGSMVLLYLLVLAGALYLTYRKVWRSVAH